MKYKMLWVAFLLAIMGISWLYIGLDEPVKVTLTPVTKGRVDLTVSNTRAGTVKACNRSRLSLPIGGQIAELFVSEGDQVKKDQVLIRLWNKDQQARLVDAKARFEMAKQAVIESCRMAERNKREQARFVELAARKLASAEALDNASTQAIISAASCKKAQANSNSADAAVSLQAAMLEKTELTAPFSGVVAEINGEVGEYITPSPSGVATPPAIDLIADNCLYLSAPVDEVEAAQIERGMAVNVTLDAFRGEQFAGEVTRIAPYVKEFEKQARTVDVDVKLLDKTQQKKFLIGYSADIDVIIQQKKNTLRLPTEAVIDGNSVLLYQPSTQRLALKTFKPGISNWRFTEVLDGLTGGDKVLLSLDAEGAIDGALVSAEE
ncbi:MAG: HlyD family secretion protein [Cycloclasticus sp.]